MAAPLTSDIIDDAASNPQCTQKPLTMDVITPTYTKNSIPAKGEPDKDSSTSDLPSDNVTITTTETYTQPAKRNLDYDNMVRWSIESATLVPITPRAVTICPTNTDPLEAIIAWLIDHINSIAAKSRRHYEMMAKIHAKLLANLQQIVQLMPQFLATLSQQIHAPHKLTRYTTCCSNSSHLSCMMAYQTKDLICTPLKSTPLKHVRIKTSAPGRQGHMMFWSKEDMCPP